MKLGYRGKTIVNGQYFGREKRFFGYLRNVALKKHACAPVGKDKGKIGNFIFIVVVICLSNTIEKRFHC
jgi:hypothetical protein